MTNIKVFSLEGCFFSQNAENLLKKNNIDYELKRISQFEKYDIKERNKMDTFPQIFWESKNEKLKIGGFTELSELHNSVNSLNNFDDVYNFVSSKINTDDKKQVLKLIEKLLNKN